MCGIIGYIGDKKAVPFLIEGLKRLEYRGYDSAGCSVIEKGELKTIKRVGKVKELENALSGMNLGGDLGIAHCLHPSTLIQLANGQVVPISKIKERDEVLALNLKTKKLDSAKIKIFEHKSPKYLYSVRAPFGTINCSAEHKMFVYSGNKIITKKASDISKDDKLIVPQTIEAEGEKIKFRDIFVKRYYKMTDAANLLIKNKLNENLTARTVVSTYAGISYSYLDHIVRNDRNFREDLLEKCMPFLSIEFPSDDFIPQNTIHGKFIDLPEESSPELMQILGYFLGDGTAQPRTIRFKDTDEEVLKIYKQLIEKVFKVEGRVVPQKGTRAYLLEVNSVYISKWLRENIVSRKKEFLEEVGQLPKEEISSFLRGIFDAEGCVATTAGQVNLGMTNESIVKLCQFLLLRFGIVSSLSIEDRKVENWNPCYKLSFSNYNSFKKFSSGINFSSKIKSEKLDALIGKKAKRALKEKGLSRGVVFQSILEIKKIKSDAEFLYDLHVAPHSNFIANGLISHNSRWASHGEPSEGNAHPHLDCKGEIAVVHNGIIENYQALKTLLEKEGHKVVSQTDTEVIPHLIEKFYQGDLEKAVVKTLKLLEGAFGLAIIHKNEPRIVVARKGSPLILGIGDGEIFVASDAAAILSHTKKVVYLNDNEIAVLEKDGFSVKNADGGLVEKEIEELKWNAEQIEKKGYKHFMLKEIFEQPQAIENTLRGRVKSDHIKLSVAIGPKTVKRAIILACGTSYYAGLAGKYIIEANNRIPVEAETAPEFRYKDPIIREGDLAIAISQSGETADTLGALREAKDRGAQSLGIVNTVGSTIAREVASGIYLHAGPEIGVAATKAFTCQLMALNLFSLYLRQIEGASPDRATLKELERIPEKIQVILEKADKIQQISANFKDAANFLFLGRGLNFPVALEGALKLKEISYIHAEGYPAAEMKHGPIALIDENMPVVFLATKDRTYEKILSNMEEVKARKGRIIAVVSEMDEKISRLAEYVIEVPATLESLSPILNVIPLQLLAYYIAGLKGIDVDRPRNLAKSVTVE